MRTRDSIVFLIFCLISTNLAKNNTFKLELLQVIFRNGDRIPDKTEIYKTDPYELQKYEQIGYGQLTRVGQLRMYKFGQVLRQKYGGFLGDYRFNKVYAYSSGYDRTKVSLQAVLASLYPPESKNSSCNNETWLSIPTYYDEKKNNFLVNTFSSEFCPKFKILVKEAQNAPEIRIRLDKYSELLRYLENTTDVGILKWPILYHNVRAGQSMNLPYPDWCNDTIFDNMNQLLATYWDSMSFSKPLRRINAGPLIKTFLKNIQENDSKNYGGRRIYLYSGHDYNVAGFTRAHNFTNIPGVPDYGSGVIVEKLRGTDDQVYLRMFYWTGVTEEIIALKFGSFGYTIPLVEYKRKVNSILPQLDDCKV